MRLFKISFCLVILLTVVIGSASALSISDTVEYPKWKDLKVVEPKDLPKNIVPFEFESKEEAEQFLKEYIDSREDDGPTIIKEADVTTRTVSDTIVLSDSATGSIGWNLTLYATIHRERDGSFGWISDVTNKYTQLTGYTLGITWVPSQDPQHNIYNSDTSCHVWQNGVIDVYLLIDGVIKIYSDAVVVFVNRKLVHRGCGCFFGPSLLVPNSFCSLLGSFPQVII